jgi:hydroxypyruvate isomerase
MVLQSMPAGDWEAGERGLVYAPGREGELQESVGLAIEYTRALNCTRLNCLAGLTPMNAPAGKIRQTLVTNLSFAATALEKEGISLLIEALNEYNMPGFHLNRTSDA